MKVALIGLDGSGKSANINIMKEDADYSDFIFMWVRWQPSITKKFYKIKHRNDVVGARTTDSVGEKKHKNLNKEYNKKAKVKDALFKMKFVRSIWMKYAISDYKKQFYRKVSEPISAGKSIIFDRYYLDLFIDQGINFGFTPDEIWNEIMKYEHLFPQMDKTIYIDVSPSVCYQRKDDIPNMEYLNRRYEIYMFLANKFNWVIINGEKPLETVYSDIKKEILGEI